jgi:hypothetical protein
MTHKNTGFFQRCIDATRVEHVLCSETSAQSSDDTNEVTSIKIEGEEIHIKEEDEPIAMLSSSIKEGTEVSPQIFHWYLGLPSVIMLFCLSAFPHKTAPCGEWKMSIYIYIVC